MTGRALPRARRVPDGGRRGRDGAAQLGRRDGEGDGRRIARQGQAGRRASPNVLRPFPAEEFRGALRGVKAVTIGDRADSYGARRQPVARSARRDPDRSARTTPRSCRASTAWRQGLLREPTPEQFFEQAIARPQRPGASPSPSPTTAPRPADPTAGRGPGCRRSAGRRLARHGASARRCRRPAGSRSSSSPCGR